MEQTLENSVYYVNSKEYFDRGTIRFSRMYTLTDYNLQIYSDNHKYFIYHNMKFFGFVKSEIYEIETVLEYLPQIIDMLDIIKNSAKKFDCNNNIFTIDDLYIRYNIINLSYYIKNRGVFKYINNMDELYDFMHEYKQYFLTNDIKIALKD